MPQGMRCSGLVHPGGEHCTLEGALEGLIEQVMPPAHAAARIDTQRGLREHPMPGPGLRRTRILARQRMRQLHAGHAVRPVALPQQARVAELRPQIGCQRLRQHQGAILVALAFAHDECEPIEVHVLHAQPQGPADPHAGAVQQSRQQAVFALHPRQHGVDFLDRQHHRQALRSPGALQVVEPGQLDLEHGAVQEEQGGKRLVMRGRGDPPAVGEHRQIRLDLRRSHLARMPAAVKADEVAHPVDVGVLGS